MAFFRKFFKRKNKSVTNPSTSLRDKKPIPQHSTSSAYREATNDEEEIVDNFIATNIILDVVEDIVIMDGSTNSPDPYDSGYNCDNNSIDFDGGSFGGGGASGDY
jgi:hypothetical protein